MTRSVIALSLACAGCQLLNTSDRPKPFIPDAGPDGAIDGGLPPIETVCTDGVDNDGDMLTDCVDYDCAPTADCCTTRPDVATFTWSEPIGNQFYGLGSPPEPGMCGAFPTPRCLVNFGSGGAIVRLCHGTVCEDTPVCDPLAAGYSVRAVFIPKSAPVGSYAAIVLTPVPERQAETQRLLDELAVTVRPNGAVEVSRAGTVLGSADAVAGANERITVDVVIGPSNEDGRAVLRATVTAQGATVPHVLLDRYPFLLATDLVRMDGCEEIGGLYFGIEGQGSGVFVDEVRVTELECTNPSDFVIPENSDQRSVLVTHDDTGPALPATHTDLGFDAWSYGGLASPSLIRVTDSMDREQWDLYVDATDVDRGLELIANIGFSIGRARTNTADDWGSWNLMDNDPRAPGSCHPSCVGPVVPGCPCGDPILSLREPHFSAGCFAWASASIGVTGAPTYTITLGGSLTFDDPGCTSERDPALAPRGGDPANKWLFYTCERAPMPTEIRVVGVNCMDSLTAEGTPIFPSLDELGPFAAAGIRAPEVLATLRPAEVGPPAVYSLWFLARDRSSRVTVGLALAEAPDTGSEPPVFTSYPANPVLANANVRQDVPCTDCRITGMAVAPLVRPENLLRFLLARTVDDSGTSRYELVPLDQAWSNPYGPL